MRIVTVMWSSYLSLMKEAADKLDIELVAYSNKQINGQPDLLDTVKEEMKRADLILLYRTNDPFWEELAREMEGSKIPVICVGSDLSSWSLSTESPDIVSTVYRYILFNGEENITNMLRFILCHLGDGTTAYDEPLELPWQGISHPEMERLFQSTEAYLSEYRKMLSFETAFFVGIIYSRTSWVTGNIAIEKALISALEKRKIGVIPVFFYPLKDEGLGNMGGVEVIEEFLVKEGRPLVQGVLKLSMFFLGNSRGSIRETEASPGACLMKKLNIPLFCPVTSYYKDKETWLHDPQGLGSQVAWSVAMPEFEGVIEPVIIGASQGVSQPENESYEPIPDRIERLAGRVERWISLRGKENHEKRVAFILHSNPCASVEATVGSGAHLDTLESVARVIKRMGEEGYRVNPPESGEALIEEIMAKKAISEFRWTTVEEIVDKGGVLDYVDLEQYLQWFHELPPETQERMAEAWGNPPGEKKNGIPPAMVYDGRIIVTGLQFGNAVVCVQPKRGCAGARCDGEVCKILHDPDVPPPHQYVATYKWLSREFGADVIIHVGTHGNLEFLPGKATGLSSGCFPDIGIDTMPHLYIYNADNPPEGTIAKRRSNAVLVDHLQTVMVQGELYGDLDELQRLVDDYEKFSPTEPARAHTIAHMIMAKSKGLNLLDGEELNHDNFEAKIKEIHDRLSLLKNTHIPKGMHIFGSLPQGERLSEFIYAIARYENSPDSLRGFVSQMLQESMGLEGERLKEKADSTAREACKRYLEEKIPLAETLSAFCEITPEAMGLLEGIRKSIDGLVEKVLRSDEMASLLNGSAGGYLEPGASGLITRGRPDVLPTGRNFYSLDPQRVPTSAAWETGKKLAEKTLDKHLEDTGRYPENIAFSWMANDIMWADGEGMSQMMFLLGVRPLWQANGRLKGFEVIGLEELGRPRIDITVRVSGITRDNFPRCMELMDEAVQAVAALDEPLDMNFVRKHSLEKMADNDITSIEENEPYEERFRKATYRIFASMPGTYQAGTQLAVYASAWKDEQDLADVFLSWNGYAYGKGVFGEKAHKSLKTSLKTVEVTFNKTVTDEYDLTGCCCYFGTHGGMINAARVVSGKEIKDYYGDTREQGEAEVRTLSEEIRRVARAKILNPKWIAGMKEHGYKGAGEISKRIGRLYGWQATTKAVDGAVFDDITRTYLMDKENKEFFEENNPWAMEEIGRRLIEAVERGLWEPAPDVRDALKEVYLEVEGWIEERMGDVRGEFQGGSIDIITKDDVQAWKEKMREVLE